jgi:hypothetical protein
MTPEQSLRERWRSTLPKGTFLQLIETSTGEGVPDAYVHLPLVCQYPYNAPIVVVREAVGLWIEFKVPPYKVADVQINWWIRYIRAGGAGGVVAPWSLSATVLSSQGSTAKPHLKHPQSMPIPPQSSPLQAARLAPPVLTPTLKTSNALTARSAARTMPEIGYWPLDGCSPQQIEQINTYIRTGEHGVVWTDWIERKATPK